MPPWPIPPPCPPGPRANALVVISVANTSAVPSRNIVMDTSIFRSRRALDLGIGPGPGLIEIAVIVQVAQAHELLSRRRQRLPADRRRSVAKTEHAARRDQRRIRHCGVAFGGWMHGAAIHRAD